MRQNFRQSGSNMNGFIQLTTCLLLLIPVSVSAGGVQLVRTPDGGLQPQAAVDTNGVVHLIYYKGDPKGGDIYYVRQEVGAAVGTTVVESGWTEPQRVNRQARTATAMGTIRGAQLAVGKKGRPHVVWDGMG